MKYKADSISSSDAAESSRKTRSQLLAIGLPLALFAFYLFVSQRTWSIGDDVSSRVNPEEPNRLRQQCSALVNAGKYQEALPCVLKLIDVYPGSHADIEMAARLYDHLGNFGEEAKLWEEYVDRAPRPVTACPMIGQAYWKQGKQKEAVAAFERCLTFDPDNADSIFFLAHALELSGQSARAGELYERGAKSAPDDSDLQLGRARILLRRGSNAEALQIALAILKKSPENADALLVAGLACTREAQFSSAREYLNRGVKLADADTDFHFALAHLDEQGRQFGDALREYDKILALVPDDAVARSRRDALREKH